MKNSKMFLPVLLALNLIVVLISQSAPRYGSPGGYGSRRQPKPPSNPQDEGLQEQARPQTSNPQLPQEETPLHSPSTASGQPTDQSRRKQPSEPKKPTPTKPGRQPSPPSEEVKQPEGAPSSDREQSQPRNPPQTERNGSPSQGRPKSPQPAPAAKPKKPRAPQPAPVKEQPQQPQPQPKGNYEGTICETLCNCQQTQIKCNEQNLRKLPSDPWPSGITSAEFDQNRISVLAPDQFNSQQMQSLKKLSISFNQLEKMETNTFSGLSNLLELSLVGNRIDSLERGSFNGLASLETLRLEQNKLTTISGAPFTELKSIKELFLDENQLKTINVEFFDQVPSLSTLSLGSNPWKCNCKLLGVLIWVNAGNTVNGEAICSKPDVMNGRKLTSLSYTDVPTMCADAWDDDSEPVISPEEERERQRMNESCSEHTSEDPLDLCYISKDVHTSPGKYVCLHCLGTREEDNGDASDSELETEEAPSDNIEVDDLSSKLDISWSVPSAANASGENNRLILHDNGTLCIEDVQVSHGGKYTCTIKLQNHTRSDSMMVNVARAAMQVAVGVVIGVVVLFGAMSAFVLRWWFSEVDKDKSQIAPMDIQETKQ